jgi:hypothetical protein
LIRAACIVALGPPLAGCVTVQDAADQIARDQARGYVNAEVGRRFPGVDARPITDCVIDNSSAQEIVTIAGGVALGRTEAATETVSTVLARPETIRCAAEGSLRAGLLG